ncbi:MAG: GC-type dockerin domain-anchored protein [Planctomycetota bacterium]
MRTAAILCALVASSSVLAQGLVDPFASEVVAYTPGSDVGPGFDDPTSALGEPTRFTGVGSFPGAVTPFNPPFLNDEVVTVGEGGSLTLRLGTPAVDAAFNPFGIDLIVFHNGGYIDAAFPDGVVGGAFFDGGSIEVSQDGVTFVPVLGVAAEDNFPTLGYLDLPGPFTDIPGSVLSDFRLPVDPTLVPDGLTFAQLVDGYAGSGGGIGIDLASVGLTEANYIRITGDADQTPEIDAVSVVRSLCEADIDGNGVLTVFDFLEFQNRFVTGDARADFDASGALDLFDFLAFQDAFTTGCP